jgi:hypothetical protein
MVSAPTLVDDARLALIVDARLLLEDDAAALPATMT